MEHSGTWQFKVDYNKGEVEGWFKGKFGEPTVEESRAGEAKLGYKFEDSAWGKNGASESLFRIFLW